MKVRNRFALLVACSSLLLGATLLAAQIAPKKAVAKAPVTATKVDPAKITVEELKQQQLPMGATPKIQRATAFAPSRPMQKIGKADLVVEDMVFAGYEGSKRKYRFKIKNQGDVASGTFRATVACTPENVLVGSAAWQYLTSVWCDLSEGTYFQVPSIAAGATQTYLMVKVQIPPLYPCAQPTAPRPRIFFNVDSLDQVDEGGPAGEDNNEDSFILCY
jgi:hypothetical protein